MSKDPSEIRAEIEETRAEMGDTVEALAYKTDVKTRAKESIAEKKDAVVETTRAIPSGIAGKARTVGQRTKETAGKAGQKPLPLALGAAAVGFLVGLVAPSTRVESEKVGPVADQVKDKARETGQEALERGKAVAQEAAQSAKETAKEAGQEQGQELSASAKEKAQEATSTN